MTAEIRQPLKLIVEIALWRQGWAWPSALALAAAAVVLHWSVGEPARRELDALRLSQVVAAAPRPLAGTAPAQDAGLPSVLAGLKSSRAPASQDAMVRRLLELAREHGVALPQSEYREQRHLSGQVLQVEVVQPVRATYPQLRAYLESVLREMPNVSLDQLSARRENVNLPQLDAQLRWSLWLAVDGNETAGVRP